MKGGKSVVSFRNGVLSIRFNQQQRRSFQRHIFELCFFFGNLFYTLSSRLPHYLGVGLLGFGTFMIVIERLQVARFNSFLHSAWYLLFIALAEISSVWAYSPVASAFGYVKFMLLIFILCVGIVQYAITSEDVERLLDLFAGVAFSEALIEFIGTPVNLWLSGYFGKYVSETNTNAFGYILLFGLIVAFYKAYIKGKRWWYLPTIIMVIGCIFSSSRKACFMSFIGILLILLFARKKRNHLLHFFLMILVTISVFTLIMTNETLYNIIGMRFEKLFDFINKTSTRDSSLSQRDFFIAYAHELFKRHPVIGNGFANFAELLSSQTGAGYYYAHNNYWEILADLGVLGFITYYWFYAYLLIKIFVQFLKRQFNDLTIVAVVMLLVEIFMEWGIISMQYLRSQLVIVLVFICIQKGNVDNKKFYYMKKSDGGE